MILAIIIVKNRKNLWERLLMGDSKPKVTGYNTFISLLRNTIKKANLLIFEHLYKNREGKFI